MSIVVKDMKQYDFYSKKEIQSEQDKLNGEIKKPFASKEVHLSGN